MSKIYFEELGELCKSGYGFVILKECHFSKQQRINSLAASTGRIFRYANTPLPTESRNNYKDSNSIGRSLTFTLKNEFYLKTVFLKNS